MKLMLYIAITFIFAIGCSTMAKDYSTSPYYNKDKGEFTNLEKTDMDISFFKAMWNWLFKGHKQSTPKKALPIVKMNPNTLFNPPDNALKFFWLGHSTILLELEGKRYLFDPVLSERASPFSWIGPKRFHPVPIKTDQLPNLDAVIISHDHYDHLDKDVITKLKERDLQFIVPQAVGSYLEKWGVIPEKIIELDWWKETNLNDVKLISLPTKHFSGRGLFDRFETQWCSWLLIGKKHKVFFSGDTGYAEFFKEIKRKFGPIDLTFIKIAAYSDMWPDLHVTPEQAVAIHKDIGGKVMVPIHWATFDLALHSWYEPIERMVNSAKQNNIKYLTPKIGEEVRIETYTNSNWWESEK